MERKEKFLKLLADSGLEFGAEMNDYEGGRYIVIASDGDIGAFSEANKMDELAAVVGGYLDSPYSFGAWYDLDQEGLPPGGCEWRVWVRGSREDVTGMADGKVS